MEESRTYKLRSQAIDVTPELATRWLDANTHNRNLRDALVNQYAGDMKAGVWDDNGETIKFTGTPDKPGLILDGQHRIAAIEKSGVTIPLLVVWGVDAKAQETIDVGARRIFSDLLTLRGEDNANVLAAIVRVVAQYKQLKELANGGTVIPTRSGSRAISNAVLLKTLNEEPGLRQIAKDAAHAATKSALTPTMIGLCWWLFSQIHPDGPADAEDFFGKLIDPDYNVVGDPIVELRKSAFNIRNLRGTHRSFTTLIAITVKAWNMFRDGTTITHPNQLRWIGGGATPERFPEAY